MDTSNTSLINLDPIKSPSVNKMGILRWGTLGFFIGFILGLFLIYVHWTFFLASLIIFTVLFGYHGSKTKTLTERLQNNKAAFISDEPLDGSERIIIWVFSFIAPVVCGGLCYYMWRHKYPTKAKQANRISWIAFLILIPIAIAIGLILPAKT